MTRLLLPLLLLTACADAALTRSVPEPQHYVLHPAALQAPGIPALRIAVRTPTLSAGLDSDRILLLEDRRRMTPFAGGRWPGDASDVLDDWLAQSLQSLPQATVIHDGGPDLAADVRLSTFITAFQAEYMQAGAPPSAHLALRFTLTDADGDQLLLQHAFDDRLQADADNLSAVVAAMEQLLQRAAEELAQKLATTPLDN